MKKIFFSALKLNLEVPENVFYSYDGEVSSILVHKYKLDRIYKRKRDYSMFRVLSEATGLYGLNKKIRNVFHIPNKYLGGESWRYINVDADSKPTFFFHTCVFRRLNKFDKIFCRGHEESEVLIDMGLQQIIEEVYIANGDKTENFNTLSKEDKCDAGGIYALLVNTQQKHFDETPEMSNNLKNWFRYNNILSDL